ncbi:restriction endonuclease subunit S [Candidatus Nitrosotenuis aquarius]|uniref:restriction endonuclease subunit S n=1 Tax=Candidatus Nitrosotenuis aquarius TaxID=1846278 RepID=UPI0013C31AA3|nr:restriction endonuclease subunit S [Candidatus Nitrosotenuis aquarius]
MQKARHGYKLVNWNYGKEIEIPDEWEIKKLKDVFDLKQGTYLDSFQTASGKFKIYGANGVIGYSNQYMHEDRTVLVSCRGEYCGATHFTDRFSWVSNNSIALIPKKKNELEPNFFYHFLKNSKFYADITGSAQPQIVVNVLQNKKIIFPILKEQQKIASILSNIDSLISQTQKIIEQTQRLKKGLMQKLLTRGIGHTEFKKVNLGKPFLTVKIPKAWTVEPFKKILSVQQNSIDLMDSQKYVRITVKRRHDGIVLRDEVYGKQILTENQFRINAGEFIISRRQIIHNACGLVPKQFDGAVVSNEYSIFSGTRQLDINYFDYFSQTDLFHKTIVLTTHGVHIEKYILLLDEWLNLKMPLPPIDEQKRITRSITVVEKKLLANLQFESHLKNLKKGLMQKLLTGQMRVKV